MPTRKPGRWVTVTLDWSKSTKNTERFDAREENAPVSALYVQRTAFTDEVPDEISLTVEW